MARKITPSFAISVLALFVALGGTGYAITKLPRNSVGTNQIKNNAVKSSKVKNKSLTAKDFKPGQLPTGATGRTGPTGATGATGSALAYAYVEGGAALNVVAEKSKGIDSFMLARPSNGVYCFQLESLWPVHAVAVTPEPSYGSPNESDKIALAQVLHNNTFGLGCPNTSDMVVVTRDISTDAPENWFFYVTLN